MSLDDYITLVYKNLSGEISTEEFSLLNKLTAQKDEYAMVRYEYEAMWDATAEAEEQIVTPQETSALFNNIIQEKKEDNIVQMTPSVSSNKLTQKKKTTVSPLKILGRISRIAAVFLLCIAAWFMFKNESVSYDVPGMYTLKDGTQVTLREGELVIDNFSDSQRKVSLTGEAIFKVTKDADRPFIVSSQHSKIQVLGTEFLVKEVDNETFIHLYEGKISTMDTRTLDTKILTAGMKVRHTEEGKIVSDERFKNLRAWSNGSIQYRNVTIKEAVEELSIIFNTEISIEDQDMSACLLTAVINAKELNAVLKRIASTFEMELMQVGNTWVIKGGTCK